MIIALVLAGIVFNPANPSLNFYTNPILLEFVFGILVFRTWSRTGSAGLSFAPVAVFALGALLSCPAVGKGRWSTGGVLLGRAGPPRCSMAGSAP